MVDHFKCSCTRVKCDVCIRYRSQGTTDRTGAHAETDDEIARWGKGVHATGLNFGDCFAYEAAREHACPLLYVGNDFSQTDVEAVP